MKSFSERSPLVIGALGLMAVATVVMAALQYQKLPFFNQGKTYAAYFADAGGLFTGAGYVDLHYRLFALNAQCVVLALTALPLACSPRKWEGISRGVARK